MSGFRLANEPTLELRRADAREGLLEALAELDRRLPLDVPVLIGGERGARRRARVDRPGDPERVVAAAGGRDAADAAAAVEAAPRRRGRAWGVATRRRARSRC